MNPRCLTCLDLMVLLDGFKLFLACTILRRSLGWVIDFSQWLRWIKHLSEARRRNHERILVRSGVLLLLVILLKVSIIVPQTWIKLMGGAKRRNHERILVRRGVLLLFVILRKVRIRVPLTSCFTCRLCLCTTLGFFLTHWVDNDISLVGIKT